MTKKKFLLQGWEVLKETAQGWQENKVPRLSAALAFYTALSISPLIVIALAVAGFLYGEQAAQGLLVDQIRNVVGGEGARAIQSIIANAQASGSGLISLVISSVVLFVSASGVFVELQDSLNTIWGVAPKPGAGILKTVKDRFLSFAMVLGTGFLLLVSLIVNTGLEFASSYMGLEDLLAGQAVSALLSFLLIMLMFAAILKVLPDVHLVWRDVWLGAALTTLLFVLGKFAIGFYLGHSSVGSSFGAAGSVIVFLVWVYYSAQILFMGAELTRAMSHCRGSRPRPTENAEAITAEARGRQGLKPQRQPT